MKKWVIAMMLFQTVILMGGKPLKEVLFTGFLPDIFSVDVSLGGENDAIILDLRSTYDLVLLETIGIRVGGRMNTRGDLQGIAFGPVEDGYLCADTSSFSLFGGFAIHHFGKQYGITTAFNFGIRGVNSEYRYGMEYEGAQNKKYTTTQYLDREFEVKLYLQSSKHFVAYIHAEFGVAEVIDRGSDLERPDYQTYFMIGAGFGF